MTTPTEDRLSQLRNLLEMDPHDAFCMYGIAMEYAKSGHHEEAIAWLTKQSQLILLTATLGTTRQGVRKIQEIQKRL